MQTITSNELPYLSFPDCRVQKMEFNIPDKIVQIETDSGYLLLNGGERIKSCKLVITNWKSINARLYRAKTKIWENLDINKLESLIDICEFEYGDHVVFKGFGSITGQWIEIIFKDAQLVVVHE